jgi:hypothetical protein
MSPALHTSRIAAGFVFVAVLVLLLSLPDRGRAAEPNTGIVTQGQTGDNYIGTPCETRGCLSVGTEIDPRRMQSALSISVGNGAIVIHADGRVDIPNGVTFTHAAKCFWNAVQTVGAHGPVFPKERCSK